MLQLPTHQPNLCRLHMERLREGWEQSEFRWRLAGHSIALAVPCGPATVRHVSVVPCWVTRSKIYVCISTFTFCIPELRQVTSLFCCGRWLCLNMVSHLFPYLSPDPLPSESVHCWPWSLNLRFQSSHRSTSFQSLPITHASFPTSHLQDEGLFSLLLTSACAYRGCLWPRGTSVLTLSQLPGPVYSVVPDTSVGSYWPNWKQWHGCHVPSCGHVWSLCRYCWIEFC